MAENRARVLFVDDEPDVRDILVKTFERRYEVLIAESGAQALALMAAQPVDLLVTDQKMPEMSGIELAARVREQGLDIPIILLTGFTDPEDIIAAINRGQVHRYITKPWDVNDLLITVKNAVELSALRRDRERLHKQLERRVEALTVLYDVSRESAQDNAPPSYDLIIDHVLAAVSRVLPYDCGTALISVDEGRSATLRMRCTGPTSEKALLTVKDATLSAYRKQSGVLLTEERVITRVTGSTSVDASPVSFPSQLAVPLLANGKPVGTLSLFSRQPNAYLPDDGQLLDVLANQTASAILSLRAAEEQYRRRLERTVESMADGVVLTDEKGRIEVINPAARRLLRLGPDPQDWSGKELEKLVGFYPFDIVRGWEYGGAQVFREELKLFDQNISAAVTAVPDEHGALRGVCVVLQDVTEQRQLDERKEEFVSIISHELRTPLTSISGALDLVLNFLAGEVNEKQRRYLAMAKDSTDKLNAIVDDLLDLSKYSKGKLKMTFEVAYLDELIEQAVEKHEPALSERNLEVQRQIPEEAVRIIGDPNRLTQVLNNLLTNAIKFTPAGGALRVSLRTTPDAPGKVALSVWNSGEEIAEADLERIFEKFEQARSVRTRAVRGTGLGLPICRSIVEAHGGRMWAEPTPKGACFVTVLPVEPPKEVLSADYEPPRVMPYTAPRRTVLVVGDDPVFGYMLKAALLTGPYRVLLTQTAADAIAVAREHRPDLIILDVRLPDIDGIRLTDIFRHDPVTRHLPVVVMSNQDERQRAFRQGARAFLQKPFQPDALLATVDALSRGLKERKEGSVLVVDDDPKIAAICVEVLTNLGFEVGSAGSLGEARKLISEKQPDMLLLDVTLPDGDGLSFLEELKAERAASPLSVIFISARTETASKVRALKAGGDDYLTKPFDALELGARVESVFRRREQELGFSPTTQLPGSGAIEREVQRRLQKKQPFAFCYLDLDNLKAFNDYYGFAKADGVVRQTGDLLREVLAQAGVPGDFLGHVAGDDFVFVTDPKSVDAICTKAIETFDRIIPLYYDRQDRERGYIETEDRFGQRRRFPLMSVSIVAVMTDGVSHDHSELSRQAAEMKKRAKSINGSVFLRSDVKLPLPSVG